MADELRVLIDSIRARARVEATREDGTVDAYKEALEFRRLMVEAAESEEPTSGDLS